MTVSESTDESEALKQTLHTYGKNVIRTQLEKYLSSLKQEFSRGMILPKKDGSTKPDTITNLSSGFNKKINMAPVPTVPKVEGYKIETSTFTICQKFQCRGQEFYDAMTKIEMVTAFTRGHVKLDACKGGQFSLFGGNIMGEFVELVPGKKIVQKWRFKQWPDGHFSTVTINIDEKVSLNFLAGIQNPPLELYKI